MEEKKVVFSLVQPSGDLTIGNYLGAVRHFVELQDEYRCFFGVANLHSITVTQVPADLRRRSREVLAVYLASGMDPEKVTMFIQSQVPQHAELGWVLSSLSSIGQLQRMTQFKDKAQKHADNLNAALLTYPVLMAADILLYQSDYVPVGADQKQHLEFTRDIAERFNSRYSDTFRVPEPLIPKSSARIMSLKDPFAKMSKSDPDVNSYILIRDDADTIRRKIARSVTDSQAHFAYHDEQPGLKNLINIYSAYTDQTPEEIVQSHTGASYADFKEELGEIVVSHMIPIREKFFEIMEEKHVLEEIYTQGAEVARQTAQRTLSKVYRKVGFI
ncbi:MAG: tryptophan--tRNA ligase [Peptoniphilaceae bacterium]|nr:tryptophan--tRNA ligase [Peptoniphilaceae bacterium]MCI6660585.1 tryptophan--tRNA ligase [Peptoniphilaceae bacterium]MDD7434420.1 tryptophan--tRNA ligase [Peptoniphilaceae bacterium]MDY3076412.1 tryptophan--tRNA ligase [Peptoniphilaceae bacterium]MDY3987005.1 tryptophan--tRNA ligase [Peptoniphilaceae bacterium]